MADATPVPEAEMPQPTPVFDITHQHVYTGRVHKQFYIFMYVGVAFLFGALLPWVADVAMPNLMQAVLAVFAVSCIVSGYIGIKGRFLSISPFMFTEILALLFLLLTYFHVDTIRSEEIINRLDVIDQSLKVMSAGVERTQLLAIRQNVYDSGVGFDIFIQPFQEFGKDGAPTLEDPLVSPWRLFGTGFYLTFLTSIFLFVFIVLSLFTGKKKSEGGEASTAAKGSAARRRDRGATGARTAGAPSRDVPPAGASAKTGVPPSPTDPKAGSDS